MYLYYYKIEYIIFIITIINLTYAIIYFRSMLCGNRKYEKNINSDISLFIFCSIQICLFCEKYLSFVPRLSSRKAAIKNFTRKKFFTHLGIRKSYEFGKPYVTGVHSSKMKWITNANIDIQFISENSWKRNYKRLKIPQCFDAGTPIICCLTKYSLKETLTTYSYLYLDVK